MTSTHLLVWPMKWNGDERTRLMLERATTAGTPEEESLHETHGMVSLARAPHEELRKAPRDDGALPMNMTRYAEFVVYVIPAAAVLVLLGIGVGQLLKRAAAHYPEAR